MHKFTVITVTPKRVTRTRDGDKEKVVAAPGGDCVIQTIEADSPSAAVGGYGRVVAEKKIGLI
jgi:hypothetical protein